MHAHEDVPPISDLAAHKCDVRLLVDLILECVKAKLPVFGWQLRRGYTLYDRLPTHPVANLDALEIPLMVSQNSSRFENRPFV